HRYGAGEFCRVKKATRMSKLFFPSPGTKPVLPRLLPSTLLPAESMKKRLALIVGATTTVAALSLLVAARQQATLVRGNAPNEWRYWGADAWSTRYSAADQINASNFDSLQVAWQ